MNANLQIKRRLRGVILKLVQQNHESQGHRYEDWTLTKAVDALGFNVNLDLVREIVQDMGERGLLLFKENRMRGVGGVAKNAEVWITEIQITPKGRDIVEGTPGVSDPGVVV